MARGSDKGLRRLGYGFLVERLGLSVLDHYKSSFLSSRSSEQVIDTGSSVQSFYPKRYDPGEGVVDNLVFALKYEGVNLGIIKAVFEKIQTNELVSYIQERPLSKYARALWFLYEFLLDKTLPLPDVTTGNYVAILDPEKYFVGNEMRSKRHRIVNNLLGPKEFCPVIRKTDALKSFCARDWKDEIDRVVGSYDPGILAKAVNYLYTKETRTSFEIERESPDIKRATRFIELLKRAPSKGDVTKQLLIDVQNAVVGDSRFAASDYRLSQNYVGEGAYLRTTIHYVSPKPEDVPRMMDGLLTSIREMTKGVVDPVVRATIASYGFVFIHPFEDGNGRTHRYLIHHILANDGFTPDGLIFPVSSTMLNQKAKYDSSLEQFSKKVVPAVDFLLNENGEMLVQNETGDFYRYMDMTSQAEYLFQTIEETLNKEFAEEIKTVLQFSRAREAIDDVVEMPDKLANLFVHSVYELGRLSSNKREKFFAMLKDEEIAEMETRVKQVFADNSDVEQSIIKGPGV